jgi:NADH-quinone oxidoreductase subunit E
MLKRFEISDSVKKEIDRWLQKYPENQKRSAVVAALLLVQNQNGGWLSEAAMKAVAEYLSLDNIEVFEVATFYDMYNLQPIGKNKIAVCTNVSCMLMGSDDILACIKKRLGIAPNETTADGKFTLFETECMAACGGAPMCQINDREYHEKLTPESMEALIDKLEKETL